MDDNKWTITPAILSGVQVTFQATTKGYHMTISAGAPHYFGRTQDSYGTYFAFDFHPKDTLYIHGDYDSMVVIGNDIWLRAFNKTYLLKDSFKYANFDWCTMEGSIAYNDNRQEVPTQDKTVTGAVITALDIEDDYYFNQAIAAYSIDGGSGKDTIQNDGTNTTIVAGMGDDEITNTASGVNIAGGTYYTIHSTKKDFVNWLRDDLSDMFPADDEYITIIGSKGTDSITSKGDDD